MPTTPTTATPDLDAFLRSHDDGTGSLRVESEGRGAAWLCWMCWAVPPAESTAVA